MNSITKIVSTTLAVVLIICAMPFQAQAATEPETIVYTEDLGDGITVETTIEMCPNLARYTYTSAITTSNFKNNGVWFATVSFKVYFKYNGITAGVTNTEYAVDVADGWSYTDHKITTTTLSTSSGGTATLTGTLKDFPLSVAVRLSLHCTPAGIISRN